jgi:hypothetical protein
VVVVPITMLDPTADRAETEIHSLTAGPDDLDGARVGLVANGKPAAKPVLSVLADRLRERHDGLTASMESVSELNLLKDADRRDSLATWAAAETDVCLTAFGDCGSCTKFLTWLTNDIEAAGVPAVGLIDQGFTGDWESNSIERGRELRYVPLGVRSEVTDRERIETAITAEEVAAVETLLTSEPERNAGEGGD